MNKTLFTSIIDFLPDATVVIDKDKKVIAWNKAIEKMTGVRREDILGKGDYAYAVAFYGEKRPMLIDLVLNASIILEDFYSSVKRDGCAIYAEAYVPGINNGAGGYLWGIATPILDENGDYGGAIESIREITDRKTTERELSESEEKFRLLFEKSCDPILLLDDDVFIDCNEAALKLIRCTSKDRLIGIHPFDISPERQPDGRLSSEKAREFINKTMKEGYHQFEWLHRTFENKILWIEVSLTVIPIHGKKVMYTVWRDITERKEIEKTLADEKKRFFTLTREAPFGIMLFDRNGRTNYVNKKFVDIFGCSLEDAPDGRTWCAKAYPDPEYRHKVIAAWLNDVDKFMNNPSLKESTQWIFKVTCKDNTQKVVSFITVSLPTGEYLLTLEDITERKKAEEEVAIRGRELQDKSKNLEEINTALKVLLKERENDKTELEERILSNVKELIFPYIEKLKRCHLHPDPMTYVEIIETNLNDIASPFLQKMGLKYIHLTPTEIEIANLIKSGKRTKEIGEMLHMSTGAINFHRNNIRKKLGLNKEKINLRSYLMSL